MEEQFSRTELLIGTDNISTLHACHVAIFGVGGVGGYAAEALARSGIGHFDLFDNDTICLSNINRQIIATHKTIGQYKVDVMAQRMKEINPQVEVNPYKVFYMPDNAQEFDFTKYDYIIDAIDTVTAKIQLVIQADKAGTPIISAMGAGNKLDPAKFEVTDIYKTSVCPLARVMRRELKTRGIKKLKVVYSKEEALKPVYPAEPENIPSGNRKKQAPGSTAFVPATAGLIIASEVIKDLITL